MNTIAELVAQLDNNDQVKAYQASQKLAERIGTAGRPDNDDEQAAVAMTLADELAAQVRIKARDGKDEEKSKYPAAVRNQVAQFLCQVADDSQVPALAAALMDLETREMARWALDRTPGAAATKALISALEQVGPEFRVGVINALANRNGPDVQAALLRAAADDDADVRLAAVEALANHPEPSNDELIVAATRNGLPRERARAQKARVRLADTLRSAGKKDAAVAIYRAILANDADEPQKKAAHLALEQLT